MLFQVTCELLHLQPNRLGKAVQVHVLKGMLLNGPLRGKFVRSPGKQCSSKRKFNLVKVTPAPVLSRLKGLDNRVVGRMEMPGRVLILR